MRFSKLVVLVLVLLFSNLTVIACEDNSEQPRSPMMPTERAIEMFETRTKRMKNDHSSRLVLGQLYLRRAKENDAFHDFLLAEKQFSRVLNATPKHQGAKLLLAQSLMAQHRFKESKVLAEEIIAAASKSASALAILGDAQVQLGDYEAAEKTYRQMLKETQSPSALARMARFHELKGEVVDAKETMARATVDQIAAGNTAESNAWYYWRYGQLLYNVGEIQAAKEQFQKAIATHPEDAPSLAMLAKIESIVGDKAKAVSMYEKALSIAEAPQTIIELADLLAMLGEQEDSQKYYTLVEAMFDEEAQDPVAGPPHARERAVYYANHDKRLPHAVELALGDLKTRSDVFAHDAAAWCYYKNKQFKLAKQHSQNALAPGTADAHLFYHAGLIEIAMGERESGRKLLRKALDINPYFSLHGRDRVQAELQD